MPAPRPYTWLERPSAAFICSAAKPTFTRSRYATKYMRARNGMRRRRTRRTARASSGSITAGPIQRSTQRPQRPQKSKRFSLCALWALCLIVRAALLPPGFEETQAAAGSWMRRARVVIQPDAQTWPLGQPKAAVSDRHARCVVDEILHPGIGEVVEVFEHL